MENNIVKSILIGLLAGLLIGLTGENWDFKLHYYAYGFHIPQNKVWFGHYGTAQAIIGGVLVSLITFLKYNKK
jgi:hypothetical protein